jgi:cephalosporin-C deacetylase-like acetyl esterase
MRRCESGVEVARVRRSRAMATYDLEGFSREIRDIVREMHGRLPVGDKGGPLEAKPVSSYAKNGFRIENFLFESFPGWQVNASVYVPTCCKPPWPAIVFPVDHSGKQFPVIQFPAQVFAMNGYLTIVFDPPGQNGEKQLGNNHFTDGVRCYVVGESSNRYFVADALRSIDYLETREDVDLSRGVAITGVSGGGFTSMVSSVLDDRIQVVGVSCSLSSIERMTVAKRYSGCPETHMYRRFLEGLDDVDLLCAGYPKPTMVMAGRHDEVFLASEMERQADQVRAFYRAGDAEDRFEFVVDDVGHSYSIEHARRFVAFLNRWLGNRPDAAVPEVRSGDLTLIPSEELSCHPRNDVNMRSLALERAKTLEKTRDVSPQAVRRSALSTVKARADETTPDCSTGPEFRVFTHFWQQLLLRPENGIELPATFVFSLDAPSAAVLHFDPDGRNHLLQSGGLLADAINFTDTEHRGFGALCVDLRGLGDSKPAVYPYEMTSWGSPDRTLSYVSAALGDSLMAMRVRDGLASLRYLRSRPEVHPDAIVVTGRGLCGLVALHVALIDGGCAAVVWDAPLGFKTLLEADDCRWSPEAFVPNVLLHYDLPEMAAAIDRPVSFFNPMDGTGRVLDSIAIEMLNVSAQRSIYATADGTASISDAIRSLLKSDVKGAVD